ncbi:MAG: class I SAM-dependent rRNA methyltransferase [Desulfuromonas sp.]|nr:class I SAM-dependent rRNA methyltransferase [Desulfuromonas sp.]
MKKNNLPQCIVGQQTVQMLGLGHPWVLEDRFTKQWPAGKSGDLIALVDEAGKFLACALRGEERIVARVLACEPVVIDSKWFENKLRAAVALRQQHAALDETNAYRLINGEGDGIPGLTVERYDEYLMVQLYTSSWAAYLPALVKAMQNVINPAGIYEKFRPQQTRALEKQDAKNGGSKRYSRLLAGQAAPPNYRVVENGLTFKVDMHEGLNTGLFMDQRSNRRDLMQRVAGKKVLNLFAYTGAFSVAAAAAGATKVTSVDVSTQYLDWARENFGLNRLNPKRHQFINGDCFAVLEQLAQQQQRFDIILMDPPSFSTTSKNRFTTSGGTSRLVTLALDILEQGGLLITSSNHQKVDLADYLKELRRGALAAGCELRVIKMAGQAEDFPYPVTFPEGRYLKYVIAVKG